MYTHYIKEDWRHHRFWLGHRPQLHVEAVLFSGSFNIGIEIGRGGDDDAMLTFCIGLFSLYVGVSGSLMRWLSNVTINDYEGRTTGIRIHDWSLWWDVWHTTNSWKSTTPKWRNGCWHPLDTFFGRTKHSEQYVSTTETVIPMPEKSYPCTVVLKDETWKRTRLPWASHKIRRAHIEIKEGVPAPGKGENSWDCDDDATYGMTCPAKTVEEGVAAVVQSVLRDRRRYGGSVNWQQKAVAQS